MSVDLVVWTVYVAQNSATTRWIDTALPRRVLTLAVHTHKHRMVLWVKKARTHHLIARDGPGSTNLQAQHLRPKGICRGRSVGVELSA